MWKSKEQKKLEAITRKHLVNAIKEYDIVLDKSEAAICDPAVISRHILRAKDISLIGGPFHYHIRSGTYGDIYDEIPWKVRFGMAQIKERLGHSDNPFVCNYNERTLINNWSEEQSDRKFIKYNAPKLSQYGHNYKSEYLRSYTKHLCNRQRDVLLTMANFPMTAHPGHQPELEAHTLRYSAPKPSTCCEDEKIAKCAREMEYQKRCYKASL